jgi:hypothetical protein
LRGIIGLAALRCAHAQKYGGVIDIGKGTALLDTVAISDTEALSVRAGQGVRCKSGECALGWVSAEEVSANRGRRGCIGCVQDGGVVRMSGGAVKFKGGTISNTFARLERKIPVCNSPNRQPWPHCMSMKTRDIEK